MAFYKEVVKTPIGVTLCGPSTSSANNTAGDAVDAVRFVAVANVAAADVLTVTNASYGQASTLTIPDPGTSTASFVLAPSSSSVVLTSTVTMTTANMTVYTTPLQLVPAPGSGLCIMVTG